MWKKSTKVTDQTATGQAGIRKKSKVPGVTITQFMEELPEGMSTPDFTRKPIALTIQEGKFAVFKAKVAGTPTPTVSWSRANGEIFFHPEVCLQKYNQSSQEHTLEFPKVAPEDADTYKCFATNEYGRALCTVVLNVIEVGFSKTRELQKAQREGELTSHYIYIYMFFLQDEKVWEILLSADKKDYERICLEYGITDFRGMLRKLIRMKSEREKEIAEFIKHIGRLKHIEVNDNGYATIELDMDLKDPSSKIFLYKDGGMVPFSLEDGKGMRHSLKQVDKRYIFTIKNLIPEDAGLYSVDVGSVNVFSTYFKIPEVDFAFKIQEVKAEEREDALFQCVLTAPMNEIKWFGKQALLSDCEKYKIIASEDKLIHKLIVQDCMPLDAGIYSAVAGINSCSAWLVVEADKDDANMGKKAARKTTMAGGGNDEDLMRIAKEQGERYRKKMEENRTIAKNAAEARKAAVQAKKEAATKAVAEAKDEAAARSNREADGKDGAAGKAKTKDTSAAGGGGSTANSAEGTGSTRGDGGALGACGGGTDTGTGIGIRDGAASGVGEQAGAAGDRTGARGEAGGRGGGGAVVIAAGVGIGGRAGAGAAAGEGAGIGRRAGTGTGVGEGAEGAIRGGDGVGEGAGAGGAIRGGAGVGIAGIAGTGFGEGAGVGIGGRAGAGTVAGMGEGAGIGRRAGTGAGESAGVGIGGGAGGAIRDPGVHFQSGLSDCKAIIGEAAELECKLSSEDSTGIWYKDGNEIKSSAGITISKEGSFHRLKIHKVSEKSAGKYKFEAEGQKTEALIIIEDPPRFDAEDLKAFKTPVTVKKGHKATFKISYTGQEPIKVSWFLEGEELSDSGNIKIEFSEGYGRLLLNKLQRKDSGEVKVKLKNECGAAEAISQLVVLDKPTPPLGPLEIVEATASAAEFKWRPPKDNGGCKISNYVLERQQVGRNTWKKIGPIGPEAQYRDTNVDRGKKYCYRIRAETEVGTSELMETENIQAGTKAYPGSPSAPKVVSASKECITLSWSPPSDTGGTSILGYNLEKRKKGGSSMWGLVNPHDEMIRAKEFAVKDVIDGMEYEFRVSAINTSGAGEYSTPSEFVFARDPKKSPGKVTDLKVTDSTYTSLSLSWTKPKQTEYEDEAQGYFVEVRPAESTIWERCNLNAITMTSYTVKGIKSLGMYWVRVIAVNNGGQGQPQELDRYILAMPPPVRPRFTDSRTKSFIIVKAGNSARFSIKYEASPWPEITWLKDGMPVTKNVLISNTETISQLLIPSSERSHSGIYTIIIKNAFGHATFSTEIRVTDDPKPPGPVEIEEKVPGTVTLSWTSSPDEKRDDRLNYMVTKCDSVKGIWQTVADNIFNNKFTDCDIMPGREYKFRVYAKNEMGSSKPSESPKWLISTKKEKFTVKMPESKACDLQCPPKFLVPLKMHTAPDGYECFMSCAITGDPTPHVTWLRNNISLNTDTNYYISNTCGVCSMLILKVGTKDTGEYKVVAENNLGRAECATQLSVRGKYLPESAYTLNALSRCSKMV
uniref:Immunoglobulin like and fibronectin type III domain containing 1, tandem duplicate 1 n=1 Tax=Monopterus albus TaxID=43700 RepID=A0A3Q3ILL6_MONAL